MSGPAWFSLGLAAGIGLMAGIPLALDRMDAVAAQYVRPAGSDTVRRIR